MNWEAPKKAPKSPFTISDLRMFFAPTDRGPKEPVALDVSCHTRSGCHPPLLLLSLIRLILQAHPEPFHLGAVGLLGVSLLTWVLPSTPPHCQYSTGSYPGLLSSRSDNCTFVPCEKQRRRSLGPSKIRVKVHRLKDYRSTCF